MHMLPYLNFDGQTEAALRHYANVLGGELSPFMRFSALPPGAMELTEEQKNLVLHARMDLPGGHVVMASDTMPGERHTVGTNMHIMINPSSRAEADRLMAELSADGGSITMPIEDQFWGDYHGQLTDRFGVQWMINYAAEQ